MAAGVHTPAAVGVAPSMAAEEASAAAVGAASAAAAASVVGMLVVAALVVAVGMLVAAVADIGKLLPAGWLLRRHDLTCRPFLLVANTRRSAQVTSPLLHS